MLTETNTQRPVHIKSTVIQTFPFYNPPNEKPTPKEAGPPATHCRLLWWTPTVLTELTFCFKNFHWFFLAFLFLPTHYIPSAICALFILYVHFSTINRVKLCFVYFMCIHIKICSDDVFMYEVSTVV